MKKIYIVKKIKEAKVNETENPNAIEIKRGNSTDLFEIRSSEDVKKIYEKFLDFGIYCEFEAEQDEKGALVTEIEDLVLDLKHRRLDVSCAEIIKIEEVYSVTADIFRVMEILHNNKEHVFEVEIIERLESTENKEFFIENKGVKYSFVSKRNSDKGIIFIFKNEDEYIPITETELEDMLLTGKSE